MEFDTSWEALTKPGYGEHFFDFDKDITLQLGSDRYETDNALLLAELSRLIYRDDDVVYCGKQRLSFSETILKQQQITWLDCFKDDSIATCAWLLKTNALDDGKKKPCLLLIFRGTNGFDNWKLNAKAIHTSYIHQGAVHKGFYDAFRSIEEKILNSDDLKKLPVILAGHSLGGALATLTMAALQEAGREIDSCYTFGSPKVGDTDFAQQFKGQKLYRVINRNDIVPMLPFDFLHYHYVHVGESHYFSDAEHLHQLEEDEIEGLQKTSLPSLERINGMESFLRMLKELDTDIPAYLTDHAPINYLARLHKLQRV